MEEDAHPEKAEELLHLFLAWSEERPRLRYHLAVVLPSRGLIGSVDVRVASVSKRQGSFGCELVPRHWGRGYALEAARALIGYGFRELGLHRVYAETLEQNAVAIELAEAPPGECPDSAAVKEVDGGSRAPCRVAAAGRSRDPGGTRYPGGVVPLLHLDHQRQDDGPLTRLFGE